MHKQIINPFTNPKQTMDDGLWFSGHDGEGEYRKWYGNGQLYQYCYYKNGEKMVNVRRGIQTVNYGHIIFGKMIKNMVNTKRGVMAVNCLIINYIKTIK